MVFLIGLASFTQTSEARACSCMRITPAEGLSSAYAVFTGEVTTIEPNTATKFGGVEITLRVKKVWKGDIGAQVQVRTAGSSAACGYSFVKGETYLVYADRDEADPMRVSLCSRTALVANAQEDLDLLGKPSQEFDDSAGRPKGKDGEAKNKDNCSASPGPTGRAGLGWVVLFLAGATLAIRRIA
jgi:MYXO-CTERM domain-containing protein